MLLHSEKDGVRLKGILRNNEKFETYFIPGNRVISVEKEVIQKEESTSSKEVPEIQFDEEKKPITQEPKKKRKKYLYKR